MARRLSVFLFSVSIVFLFTIVATLALWTSVLSDIMGSSSGASVSKNSMVFDALVIDYAEIYTIDREGFVETYISYRVRNLGDNNVTLVMVSIDNKYNVSIKPIVLHSNEAYSSTVVLENVSLYSGSVHKVIVYFYGYYGLKHIDVNAIVR